MIIHNLKNILFESENDTDKKDKLKVFLDKLVSIESKYFNKKSYLNEGGYEDNKDTENQARLFQNKIFTIINCLMRSDELTYHNRNTIFKKVDLSLDSSLISGIISNEEYYKVDYLNLEDVYLEWCKSFDRVYKDYHLINTSEEKGTIIAHCKNNKVDLNSIYKAIDGNNKSRTPFDDRYSKVINFSQQKRIRLIFNKDFGSYKIMNKWFNEKEFLIVPYQLIYENTKDFAKNFTITINPHLLNVAFESFKKELIRLYEVVDENSNTVDYSSGYRSQTTDSNSKLAMYRTLKNLFDRHFSSIVDEKDKFKVLDDDYYNDTEFSRFHFIDTLYNDLGDEFYINLTTLLDLLNIVVDGYQSGSDGFFRSEMSIYSFMSLLCQKHNMLLLAMPVFNKNGDKDLEHMFTPISYNESSEDNVLVGPSYVCFYPHQASQHLDLPYGQYADDGFNIIQDINSTSSFAGPVSINDLNDGESEYSIPAFAVEYGSQKQSIFKNVNVNMDNPQTTEAAVATMFNISKSANGGARDLVYDGQDLFKIYSNYSYTCQVEMMGCAQIQPLMYFQLNNIPMFRGAYQIIQVEHDITPGNMTTSFKGVRINRTKIPMSKNCVSLKIISDIMGRQNNVHDDLKKDTELKRYDIIYNNNNTGYMETEMNVTENYLSSNYREYIQFGENVDFDSLNLTLRQLIFCVIKDMKELYSTSGKRYGIYVTSATRKATINNNTKSDHLINSDKCTALRKRIKSVDGKNVEKTLSELGCAIDIVGTNNGKTDNGEASLYIFDLLLNKYSTYIYQLIWEVASGFSVSNNAISNCIHIGSYGKRSEVGNNTYVFVACADNNFNSYRGDAKNLPKNFISILDKLLTNNESEFNSIYFNNFANEGSKPSSKTIKSLLA